MGGTVRDLLMGARPKDIDLVMTADPRETARAFADALGGSYFPLSEEFRLCRVISAGGVTYDFSKCRGGGIIDDLRRRDFTVNAMAIEVPGGGEVIDPLGGREHLARRRLVAVSSGIFTEDPLRLLRAVRLEKTLGLEMSPELAALAGANASLANRPAAERRFYELVRILEVPGTGAAVRRLEGLGLLAELLPELDALKGISQNDFHHLDVFDHTLAAADELGALVTDPSRVFPKAAAELSERFTLPVAGDADTRQVLSLAAVMHDIGKPDCRFTDEQERVRFIDHDRHSAAMVKRVLKRFRASSRATEAVALLVRQHMRLVSLVKSQPVSRRARLRYFRALEPFVPESILLSVSDRLAVRGPASTAGEIESHLAFAREMMDQYLYEEENGPPPRLVHGDEIMAELGLEPGPLIGRILRGIEEEQQLGRVGTREEALSLARELAGRER